MMEGLDRNLLPAENGLHEILGCGSGYRQPYWGEGCWPSYPKGLLRGGRSAGSHQRGQELFLLSVYHRINFHPFVYLGGIMSGMLRA